MAIDISVTNEARKLHSRKTNADLEQINRQISQLEADLAVAKAKRTEFESVVAEYAKTDYDAVLRPVIEIGE